MKIGPLSAVLAGIAATLVISSPLIAQDKVRLIGSGASFPFPIYAAWFKEFGKTSNGITVDYQAKGSGAGIQDLINKTVDFAASDSAMTDEQIAKVPQGVQLLPMTAGEVVLAYNLPGVKQSAPAARCLSGDLSRQDHQVERSEDRRRESRCEAARPSDHGRAPRRQQRHDVRRSPIT